MEAVPNPIRNIQIEKMDLPPRAKSAPPTRSKALSEQMGANKGSLSNVGPCAVVPRLKLSEVTDNDVKKTSLPTTITNVFQTKIDSKLDNEDKENTPSSGGGGDIGGGGDNQLQVGGGGIVKPRGARNGKPRGKRAGKRNKERQAKRMVNKDEGILVGPLHNNNIGGGGDRGDGMLVSQWTHRTASSGSQSDTRPTQKQMDAQIPDLKAAFGRMMVESGSSLEKVVGVESEESVVTSRLVYSINELFKIWRMPASQVKPIIKNEDCNNKSHGQLMERVKSERDGKTERYQGEDLKKNTIFPQDRLEQEVTGNDEFPEMMKIRELEAKERDGDFPFVQGKAPFTPRDKPEKWRPDNENLKKIKLKSKEESPEKTTPPPPPPTLAEEQDLSSGDDMIDDGDDVEIGPFELSEKKRPMRPMGQPGVMRPPFHTGGAILEKSHVPVAQAVSMAAQSVPMAAQPVPIIGPVIGPVLYTVPNMYNNYVIGYGYGQIVYTNNNGYIPYQVSPQISQTSINNSSRRSTPNNEAAH